MLGPKRKMFFNLDQAREFGQAVDFIAEETMIPTGKRGTPHPIFPECGPDSQPIEHGKFFYIDQEEGVRGENTFYVRYTTFSPKNSSKADVLQADRQVTEYLNQKYAELGPDTGFSRG